MLCLIFYSMYPNPFKHESKQAYIQIIRMSCLRTWLKGSHVPWNIPYNFNSFHNFERLISVCLFWALSLGLQTGLKGKCTKILQTQVPKELTFLIDQINFVHFECEIQIIEPKSGPLENVDKIVEFSYPRSLYFDNLHDIICFQLQFQDRLFF